ncbi:hypothetical protein [Blastococcus montanus]|uniref:hypothetical protein n=1 Tax=Blastococcus montanus TaxID=3144973 RepID=UPI00320821B1
MPQVFGRPKELPFNYFQLARSAGYRMGEGELLWRTATFHIGAGNVAHLVVNAPGTRSTATRLFDPPGPRRPSGVR